MKSVLGCSVLLFAILSVSGCSVLLANTGMPNPNLSVVQVGATRGQLELELGYPVSSTRLPEGGSVEIYQFELGRGPNDQRAMTHGLMDLLTLGIWEVPGTIIEMSVGEKRRIQVTYGPDDRVTEFRAAPEAKPSTPDTPPDRAHSMRREK